MSTSLTWPPIGGTSYSIPASGEVDWPALSNFLIALGDGAQPQTYQKVAIRTATATPITVVSATDCIVVSNLSVAGAVAVTLPAGVAGQWYAIIDGKADAATNNITITPNGVETIQGTTTYVIKANRGGVIIAFSGTNWTVVAEYLAATNQGNTGTGLIVRQTSPTLITPTVSTSITAPLVAGGSTASSTLTLQSTTGNGTSDRVLVKVGNNGAVTGLAIETDGTSTIGNTAKIASNNYLGTQIVGKTDGANVVTGYVGEVVDAGALSNTACNATSNVETDVTGASITLSAGTWQIFYSTTIDYTTAASSGNNGYTSIFITDSANTHIGRSERSAFCITRAAATNDITACAAATAIVKITASTTYKLRIKKIDVSGTGSGSLVVSTGNTDNNFYAVRIA